MNPYLSYHSLKFYKICLMYFEVCAREQYEKQQLITKKSQNFENSNWQRAFLIQCDIQTEKNMNRFGTVSVTRKSTVLEILNENRKK